MEQTIKTVKPVIIEPTLLTMPIVNETLDMALITSYRRITWTDARNKERDIQKLTDAHIAALAPWLRRRGLHRTEKIIQGELERRATEFYPDWFDDEVDEYKKNPEIWRLKIYSH